MHGLEKVGPETNQQPKMRDCIQNLISEMANLCRHAKLQTQFISDSEVEMGIFKIVLSEQCFFQFEPNQILGHYAKFRIEANSFRRSQNSLLVSTC